MRLDPFGDDGQAEAEAEPDHGAHDRGRLRVRVDVAHERAVDLDPVEGKGPQVGERGVARPEIVHRDPHAERPQLLQRRDRTIEVADQCRLRDLQLQAPGRQSRLQEHRLHLGGEGGVVNLHRGHVHGHAQGSDPARRFAAGGPQHPEPDRGDRPAILGDRDEDLGETRAPFRMGPAQQRLEPDQDAALGLDLPLVDEVEFARAPGRIRDRVPCRGARGWRCPISGSKMR